MICKVDGINYVIPAFPLGNNTPTSEYDPVKVKNNKKNHKIWMTDMIWGSESVASDLWFATLSTMSQWPIICMS